MAAELQNVGLRKDVELPTVRLEEAEKQVLLLEGEMFRIASLTIA
jgi:hypothetical protein